MKIFIFGILLFTVSCSHFSGYKTFEIKDDKIATGYKLKKYGQIYIGGQPSSVDFIKLRQEGFVAIINLREHKENSSNYNEKWERNNSLLSGMSYYHAGFTSDKDKLSETFIDKINGVLRTELPKGKVLIHGKFLSRSAMFVAANIHTNYNVPSEKSLQVGLKLGVKSKELIHLKKFLGSK